MAKKGAHLQIGDGVLEGFDLLSGIQGLESNLRERHLFLTHQLLQTTGQSTLVVIQEHVIRPAHLLVHTVIKTHMELKICRYAADRQQEAPESSESSIKAYLRRRIVGPRGVQRLLGDLGKGASHIIGLHLTTLIVIIAWTDHHQVSAMVRTPIRAFTASHAAATLRKCSRE